MLRRNKVSFGLFLRLEVVVYPARGPVIVSVLVWTGERG
jgi:hypothetical protein